MLGRAGVADFTDSIKITIMLSETTLNKQLNDNQKNQKKCIKMQFLSAFSDIPKIPNFW